MRLVLEDPLQDEKWDIMLPFAVMAINTSYHSSIGHTPFEMTYGRRLPLQSKTLQEDETIYDIQTKLIQHYLDDCHANAVAIQSSSQKKSREYYEQKHRSVFFEVGDRVISRVNLN